MNIIGYIFLSVVFVVAFVATLAALAGVAVLIYRDLRRALRARPDEGNEQ